MPSLNYVKNKVVERGRVWNVSEIFIAYADRFFQYLGIKIGIRALNGRDQHMGVFAAALFPVNWCDCP